MARVVIDASDNGMVILMVWREISQEHINLKGKRHSCDIFFIAICHRVDKWVSPEWHRTMGFCDRNIPLWYPKVSGFFQDPGGRSLTQNPSVIRGYAMKSLGSEHLDNVIEGYRELAVVGITSSLNISIVHSTYQYHTHSFIYNIFNLNNTSC